MFLFRSSWGVLFAFFISFDEGISLRDKSKIFIQFYYFSFHFQLNFFSETLLYFDFSFFFVLLSASFFSSVLLFAFLPVKSFLETFLVLLLFFLPFLLHFRFLMGEAKSKDGKKNLSPACKDSPLIAKRQASKNILI